MGGVGHFVGGVLENPDVVGLWAGLAVEGAVPVLVWVVGMEYQQSVAVVDVELVVDDAVGFDDEMPVGAFVGGEGVRSVDGVSVDGDDVDGGVGAMFGGDG